MSQTDLSAVLAALPHLSRVELETVIAAATALKAAPRQRPKQVKPAKQAKPAKGSGVEEKASEKVQVKPARVDSIHKDVQEYINFKKADKVLHKLLKEYKTDLKSVEAFLKGDEKAIKSLIGSDEKAHEVALGKIDPVIREFRTAQDAWFRRKTELAIGNDTVAAENSSASPSGPAVKPPEGQGA